MRHRIILLFVFVLSFLLVAHVNAQSNLSNLSCIAPSPSISDPQVVTVHNAQIENISDERSAIQVKCQNHSLELLTIPVKTPELRAALQRFVQGDRVNLEYSKEAGLQSLSVEAYQLGFWRRILTLVITTIGLVFFFWLFLGWAGERLQALIIGTDGRYSNSKTQIVLWFFVLIVTYISFTFWRGWYGGTDFVGSIEIPQNLLLLSGLSALTFAAAKGITQSKINQGIPKKQNDDKPSFPADLFKDDDKNVDLGDFQMIIITLLAVVVYLIEVYGFLGTIELYRIVSLPDVDTTILATFGLGQGAYLAKKFVGDTVEKKQET